MDIHEKLNLLGQAARYDDCVGGVRGGNSANGVGSVPSADPLESYGLFARPEAVCPAGPDMFPYVSHVQTPQGQRVPVLKVLQTSACQNDCLYCAFRAGRDFRRSHLTPDELAHGFDLMVRSGVVQGMFLSSGIAGRLRTMDEMLASAELVRSKYGFRGYLHLKVLPGAEAAQIARAVELADRVSVNLEAPTTDRLAVLAPHKHMAELVGLLRSAAGIIHEYHKAIRSPWPVWRSQDDRIGPEQRQTSWGHVRLGMSTQFVVGPAGESDRELLTTVQTLYREVRLARAYYSAFNPIPDTPLEGVAPTDPRREFRLYQADWLLRYYGFSVEELPFDTNGQLDQAVNPKVAWAQAHPEYFPLEINRAPLADLLRVPGIGPVSAKAIVMARQQGRLRELGDLRRLGARAEQAAPYVLLAGMRPPHQPPLPL